MLSESLDNVFGVRIMQTVIFVSFFFEKATNIPEKNYCVIVRDFTELED